MFEKEDRRKQTNPNTHAHTNPTAPILGLKKLDKVVEHTIEAVEQGRDQIQDILRMTMDEQQRLVTEYESLKEEMRQVISDVDKTDVIVKRSRVKLMEVHRDFQSYSEQEVRDAYAFAQEVQIKLALLREQEKTMRIRRDDYEHRLREVHDTVKKAEDLSNKVTAAVEYLRGNFGDLNSQISELERRQELAMRVIQAQEEERKRLAREIHDGPAQSLASVVMRLELCGRLCDTDLDRARAELNDLKETVRDNLREVRQIIFDLRPMALDDLGLTHTVRRYFESLMEKGWPPIELETDGDEKVLPLEYRVSCFRLIQEALNNIKKHANAAQIWVDMSFNEAGMVLIVRDDGVGFDSDEDNLELRENGHYGLVGMRERADLMTGDFQLKSVPGHGTTIRIQIPVPASGEEEEQ